MQKITEKEIIRRLQIDNPWWESAEKAISAYPQQRDFFAPFYALLTSPVKRATVLMGARRVGKTIMMKQAIAQLIHKASIAPQNILYMSLETPTYNFYGHSLESYVQLFLSLLPAKNKKPCYIFFDEIQYYKDWEVHLKSLVDTYDSIRFVVSGSAAAALKLKSRESGAGRFSDFELPPVNFYEFFRFRNNLNHDAVDDKVKKALHDKNELIVINRHFIDYLNFGGFPEAIMNPAIQDNLDQFIRSDIIDKVLLKDIPDLYGISNIQELNRLFTTLAYNTGRELNTLTLAQESDMHHATVEKYLHYLQAAFLIKVLYRIDSNARSFKRQTTYKVYLTNPCIRQALFGPITETGNDFGHIVETAVFSHLLQSHKSLNLYYARWKEKEIDFAILNQQQKVKELIEVKWSDNIKKETYATLETYAKKNEAIIPILLTKSSHGKKGKVEIWSVSTYCLFLGLQNRTAQLETTASQYKEHLKHLIS